MQRTYIALLALAVLAGCGGGGSSDQPNQGGAKLSLSATGSGIRAADRGLLRTAGEVDFDLGSAGFTQRYLFLLENTGTEDATNVVLTADHPAVTIHPAVIRTVRPAGAGGVKPVVEVTLAHGIGTSGIGEAAILSPQTLTFAVTATADQTTNTSTMRVLPLVANYVVTVGDESGWIPPTYPNGTMYMFEQSCVIGDDQTSSLQGHTGGWEFTGPTATTQLPGPTPIVGQALEADPHILRLTNTGNCSLRIKHRRCSYRDGLNPWTRREIISDDLVGPGESVWLPSTVSGHSTYRVFDSMLEIEAQAVFNQSLLAPYRTGTRLDWYWVAYSLPASG